MRQIREVLRLQQLSGKSHRDISATTSLSKGSVSDHQKRARIGGLTWAEAESITESEVEARLCNSIGRNEPPPRVAINFDAREMRGAGVTLGCCGSSIATR